MTSHHEHAPGGYEKPLPIVHPENRPYWDYLKAHELRMQKCLDCGTIRYPISPVCYKCFSWKHEWVKLSGRGKIGAWVIVAQGSPGFAKEVPYNVALVDLEEGPRLTTNIINVKNEDLKLGMPVEIVFEDVTPQITLPKFKLAAAKKSTGR